MNFAVRGAPTVSVRSHIRRLWTTSGYRTIDGTWDQLSIWHLPGEKRRGFLEMHPHTLDRNSWFWLADRDEFVTAAARIMHIDRGAMEIAQDTAKAWAHKARKALGR